MPRDLLNHSATYFLRQCLSVSLTRLTGRVAEIRVSPALSTGLTDVCLYLGLDDLRFSCLHNNLLTEQPC